MNKIINQKGITIVVPVYNSEKYLEACLNSVSHQNYQNYEVVVVNDGSKDNSLDIIKNFTERDQRFKLVNQENHGISHARNTGVYHASKEYVCFVDSDDQITEDYLLTFNNYLADDVEIVTALFAEFNGNMITKQDVNYEVVDGATAFSKILKNDNLTYYAYGKCIKTELMLKHLFPIGKIYEDAFTIPQLLYSAKKVCITDAPTYLYIRREGSITMSEFSKKDLDCIEAHLNNYQFTLKNAKNDSDAALSRLLWSKLYVLDRMVMANDYELYSQIKDSLLKDYDLAIKNQYLTKFRKIGIFLVKHSKSLFVIYTKTVYKHKKYF